MAIDDSVLTAVREAFSENDIERAVTILSGLPRKPETSSQMYSLMAEAALLEMYNQSALALAALEQGKCMEALEQFRKGTACLALSNCYERMAERAGLQQGYQADSG